MTPTPSLETRIIQMISQLCAVLPADIRVQDRLREDLGLDSVCSMELISMLAEELDLDVALEEAMGVTTVAGAIEMARRHMLAKAG